MITPLHGDSRQQDSSVSKRSVADERKESVVDKEEEKKSAVGEKKEKTKEQVIVKKEVVDKASSQRRGRDEKAKEEVKKNPLLLSERQKELMPSVYSYLNAQNVIVRPFLEKLAHGSFLNSFLQVLGVEDSLQRCGRAMDDATIKDLNLVQGPLSNGSYSFVNKLGEILGVRDNLIIMFELLIRTITVNNDSVRLGQVGECIKELSEDSKVNMGVLGDLAKFNASQKYVLPFLFKNLMLSGLMLATSNLIDPARDPIVGWAIMAGMINPEDIEKSDLGVWWTKFMKLDVGLLETFTELERHSDTFTKVFNTGQWILSLLTFGYIPKLGKKDAIMFSLADRPGEKRLPYRMVNFLWCRCNAGWGYFFRGKGKLIHIVTGGGKDDYSNCLFYDNDLRVYDTNKMGWFNLCTWIFSWPLHGFLDLSRSMLVIIRNFMQMYNDIQRWQVMPREVGMWVQGLSEGYGQMLHAYDIIKSSDNDKLKKVLGPMLKKLEALVACKEIDKAMKKCKKVVVKPITFLQALSPFHTASIESFTAFKAVTHMSPEADSIFKEAVIAYSSLQLHCALSRQVWLTKNRLTPNPMSFTAVKNQVEPIIQIKNGYSPMIPDHKRVANNYDFGAVSGVKKHKNVIIGTGMNACGKSVTLGEAPAQSTVLHLMYNMVFGEEGSVMNRVDRVIFLGAITGDVAQGSSKFEREGIIVKDKLHAFLEAPENRDKSILLILDEFGSGSNVYEIEAFIVALVKYISTKPNVQLILITHDLALINLPCDKYKNVAYYTIGYDEEASRFTRKIEEGTLKYIASLPILESMNFPKELLEDMKEHLRNNPNYPFRDLVPGRKNRVDAFGMFLNMVLVIFFGGGTAFVVYRRRRGRDVEEEWLQKD